MDVAIRNLTTAVKEAQTALDRAQRHLQNHPAPDSDGGKSVRAVLAYRKDALDIAKEHLDAYKAGRQPFKITFIDPELYEMELEGDVKVPESSEPDPPKRKSRKPVETEGVPEE